MTGPVCSAVHPARLAPDTVPVHPSSHPDGAPAGSGGLAGDLHEELRRYVLAWRRVRWLVVPFAVLQFLLWTPPPGARLPLSPLAIGLLVGLTVALTTASAYPRGGLATARTVRRMMILMVAVDGLLVLAVVAFFGCFDPAVVIWPLLVVPILEASLLWQARATFAVWAGLAGALAVVQVLVRLSGGRVTTVADLSFEFAVLLLAAAISGRRSSVLSTRLRELEAARWQLAHQATHDRLTGLPNRALGDDRLQLAFQRARRSGQLVGVLFVDCDDFKTINDRWGHAAGDAVLVEVARRLAEAVRTGDTVARYGGDEFIAVLDGLPDPTAAHLVAERARACLAEPWSANPGLARLSASLGVAVTGPGRDTPEALLRAADRALYDAKIGGKNAWCAAG